MSMLFHTLNKVFGMARIEFAFVTIGYDISIERYVNIIEIIG